MHICTIHIYINSMLKIENLSLHMYFYVGVAKEKEVNIESVVDCGIACSTNKNCNSFRYRPHPLLQCIFLLVRHYMNCKQNTF